MSNVDQNAKVSPKKELSATIRCDLYNPTRARRIVLDGIDGSMRQIMIGPGETRRGVTISRTIAEELRNRNRKTPKSEVESK